MVRPKKFKIKKKEKITKKAAYQRSSKFWREKNNQVLRKTPSFYFRNLSTFVDREVTLISLKYIPHIPRIFSARISRLAVFAFLTTSIVFFFCINLLSLSFEFHRTTSSTLADYENSVSHEQLGKTFLENNDYQHAKQEFMIANKLDPTNKDVLSFIKLTDTFIEKPSQITNELTRWNSILKDKPNYRDGYFTLAVLYYQAFQINEAKKNVLKALELDPNFQPAKQLLKLLSR